VDSLIWRFGRFTLIGNRRLLLSDDLPVRLGGRALDILIALVESAGEFISRDDLIARTWGARIVEEINLRVHIAALRRILGDDDQGEPRYILNSPAKGYCFVAPVMRSGQRPLVAPVVRISPAPRQAPATVIGRDSFVADLADELQGSRLATIVGPGGIGKSAVATNVVTALAPRFPHGVCYVDLGGIADSETALVHLADALRYAPRECAAVEGLANSLCDRQVLLVLDGCEGVVDLLAMLVEEVLATTANVVVLATSREPLRVRGERVHRLTSLSIPPIGFASSIETTSDFSAIRLLLERARAASSNFELVESDVPHLTEICRRLDGIPLAIELAACRIEHLGVRGLLKEIDDGFDILEDIRPVHVPRHRSLRASFGWSFAGLTTEEQTALVNLSVFEAAFSLAYGVQLISITDADEGAAEIIGGLVAKSLVTVGVGKVGVCYRLLGVTRQYARELLNRRSDDSSVYRRHATLMVSTFKAATDERARLSMRTWSERYASCVHDVRSAVAWVSRQSNEEALLLSLLAATVPLWFQLSAINEFCEWAGTGLGKIADASDVDETDRIRVWSALGHARLQMWGPHEEALAAFNRALELAEKLGEPVHQLIALWGLWLDHGLQGRYSDALAKAEQYENVVIALNVSGDIATDRMRLVSLYGVGRHAEARVHGERALASILLAAQPDTGGGPQLDHEATTRVNLARVLWIQGLPDRALMMAKEGVCVARNSSNDLTSCFCLQGLCLIALWMGESEVSRSAASELSQMASIHRLPYWMAWGRFYLIASGLVNGSQVRADWREPLCGTRQLEIMATLSTNPAEPEILAQPYNGYMRWCEPEILRARGCQARQLGTAQSRAQALTLFECALHLAQEQGALSWELRIATSIAEQRNQGQQCASAATLLGATLAKFTEGFQTPDFRRADYLLSQLRSK